MALNFGVNILLLLCAERLAGEECSPLRLLIGALLGAVYSGVCLTPWGRALRDWYPLALAAVGAAAFGLDDGGRRGCGCFVLLALALTATAMLMGTRGPAAAVLSGGLVLALGSGSFARSASLIPVRIRWGNREVALRALRDTGNLLRDPVTGEGVLVIGPEPAGILTGLTAGDLLDPLGTMGKIPGLRLIPYHCVGRSGLLLAMRFPQVTVGRRTGPGIVAFAPEGLEGETYQALAGGSL